MKKASIHLLALENCNKSVNNCCLNNLTSKYQQLWEKDVNIFPNQDAVDLHEFYTICGNY